MSEHGEPVSSLEFVPRTLKRRKHEAEKPSISSPQVSPTLTPQSTATRQPQDINPSWDFAFLVWLALSDYCFFADDIPDDPSRYLSLDHLLKHSYVSRLLSNRQPYCNATETTYVNSLRQFAKDLIDVRFIIDPESSSSTRAAVIGKRKRNVQSGYEVRRADFSSLKTSEFSQYGKSDWDALTIYVENIPIQYSNITGIARLMAALLPPSGGSLIKRFQNIMFPPHHQDPPSSIPICKGFALVTLSSKDDVQALIDAWPWDSKERANSRATTTEGKGSDRTAEEGAAKANHLRICTRAHLEELRAEYLLYRQRLINEVNQYQDANEVHWPKETTDQGRCKDSRGMDDSQGEQIRPTGIVPSVSTYPTACLVFVRHVHPETNKTTLRTFFSQAWAEPNDAIDYVDYSKNMDSCYVRFGTPAYAEFFVDYFSRHHITQLSGLDNRGSKSVEANAVVPEIVLGKREEVYWDRIPEKIRRQAVEKTMAMHGRA